MKWTSAPSTPNFIILSLLLLFSTILITHASTLSQMVDDYSHCTNAVYFRPHANLMSSNPFKLLNVCYIAMEIVRSQHTVATSREQNWDYFFYVRVFDGKCCSSFTGEIRKFIKNSINLAQLLLTRNVICYYKFQLTNWIILFYFLYTWNFET